MKRYGEEIKLTQGLLDDIAFYMDGGIRETHSFRNGTMRAGSFFKEIPGN